MEISVICMGWVIFALGWVKIVYYGMLMPILNCGTLPKCKKMVLYSKAF
jgi:hypothetical protein